MGDVAMTARVAKATLYNHFRSKDEVLRALAEDRLDVALAMLAEAGRERGAAAALVAVAESLGTDRALRRLAATEPAVLAQVLAADLEARGPRRRALAGLAELLAPVCADPAAAAPGAEMALRWLTGQVLTPAAGRDLTFGARALVAGLRQAVPTG